MLQFIKNSQDHQNYSIQCAHVHLCTFWLQLTDNLLADVDKICVYNVNNVCKDARFEHNRQTRVVLKRFFYVNSSVSDIAHRRLCLLKYICCLIPRFFCGPFLTGISQADISVKGWREKRERDRGDEGEDEDERGKERERNSTKNVWMKGNIRWKKHQFTC